MKYRSKLITHFLCISNDFLEGVDKNEQIFNEAIKNNLRSLHMVEKDIDFDILKMILSFNPEMIYKQTCSEIQSADEKLFNFMDNYVKNQVIFLLMKLLKN